MERYRLKVLQFYSWLYEDIHSFSSFLLCWRILLRSSGVLPPYMPSDSRHLMAKSRHLSLTGQVSQINFGVIHAVEAALLVELELGKKMAVSTLMQAACSCHAVEAAISDNWLSMGHRAGRSSG